MQIAIDQIENEEVTPKKVTWLQRITQKKSATKSDIPAGDVTRKSAMESDITHSNVTAKSDITALKKVTWYVKVWNVICFVFYYVVTGKWIVDLVRWLIDTGGNVAESAFLLATIYVTLTTVAHMLVTWILPINVILTLNQISVIAFSVLPELIIFAALKITYDHWKMVQATKRIDAWAWAIAYSVPTLIFLVMTIITITSFVSLEAISATAPQATGVMLVLRCLAGWWYGMVQILFAKIGKHGYAELVTELRQTVAGLEQLVKEGDAMNANLVKDIASLQQEKATLEQELQELRIASASARVTRRNITLPVADVTFENSNVTPLNVSAIAQSNVTSHNSKKSTITAKNVTAKSAIKSDIDTTEAKFERLKQHLQNAVLRGEKVILKQIALEANVSYGMARQRAKEIIDGLSQSSNSAIEIDM